MHVKVQVVLVQFKAGTHKEGGRPRDWRLPLRTLLGPHEKNGAVLLQNAASTPLGTHEHLRVRFRIRGPRDRVEDPPLEPHEKNGAVLLQNAALAGFGQKRPWDFIRATRKERRGFAAECGPDPFGHTRALEGPS